MKSLFAVIALVACTSVQANVGAQPVKASAQPAWVKDMEVIHCSSGDCYNYKTRMQYFDYDGPEGITVAFPIEKYPPEKVKAMNKEVTEYLEQYGIPDQ